MDAQNGRIASRRWVWAVVLPVLLTVIGATAASAADARKPMDRRDSKRRKSMPSRITILKKGSSSKKSQKSAKSALPLRKMSPAVRRRVESIVRHASLFRELPSLRFEVAPKAYLYFTAHPDVAVSIWGVLGISKFKLKQNSRTLYMADSGDGTKGKMEIVYRGAGHIVVICDGVYKNPLLFKSIKTKSLIHLQATFSQDRKRKTFVTHRAFLHVWFPSTAMETAAKLISPVSNVVIDKNFQEISLFIHIMSRAMSHQPRWMERVTAKLQDVENSRKRELLKLTAQVYLSERKRAGLPVEVPSRNTIPRTAAKPTNEIR